MSNEDKTNEPKWEVGAVVAHENGNLTKVDKVYKNGNVVLSDNPRQQYRVNGLIGITTGGNRFYDLRTIYLGTEDALMRAGITREKRRRNAVAREVIERLKDYRAPRNNPVDVPNEVMTYLEALCEALRDQP